MAQVLHEKYLPVLQFARDERFYPMAIDDFLRYCTLRTKGSNTVLAAEGQVTPERLMRVEGQGIDFYLQSVPAALADQNVASRWSKDVLRSLVEFSYRPPQWQESLARAAYDWFSAKTQTATRLFWWNRLVMPLVETGRRSPQDLPRLSLPPEIQQAAVENYERCERGVASSTRSPSYTYYYRTTRDARYLSLQYWFFYGYNDWATSFGGMNDHEGDWEGLYLFFKLDSAGCPQEPPAYVTYVGHHSRLTKPWGHADLTLHGSHPVAYVAAGSHASYPERKRYELMKIYGLVDYATGDGLTIEPGDWRRGVDLDTQPWASAFLGSWGTRYWLSASWLQRVVGAVKTEAGELGLPAVSAPRGPRYAEDGSERPNWGSAALWAGILDLEKG